MKTAFTSNRKSMATATILTATLITVLGSLVASGEAHAERGSQAAMRQTAPQKMDTIVVTAPRFYRLASMETPVVVASREADRAPKLKVASN